MENLSPLSKLEPTSVGWSDHEQAAINTAEKTIKMVEDSGGWGLSVPVHQSNSKVTWHTTKTTQPTHPEVLIGLWKGFSLTMWDNIFQLIDALLWLRRNTGTRTSGAIKIVVTIQRENQHQHNKHVKKKKSSAAALTAAAAEQHYTQQSYRADRSDHPTASGWAGSLMMLCPPIGSGRHLKGPISCSHWFPLHLPSTPCFSTASNTSNTLTLSVTPLQEEPACWSLTTPSANTLKTAAGAAAGRSCCPVGDGNPNSSEAGDYFYWRYWANSSEGQSTEKIINQFLKVICGDSDP